MNIQSYLPSKKVRILVITLIVLLLGYVVYLLIGKNIGTNSNNFVEVALVDNKKSELFIDTDGDGAYDWEEALWPELDPNNPDSDGDGVLDGKYIQNKRAIAERERLGGSFLESNLSETEKLGRSTLTALIAVVQAGGTLDANTEAQFSENVTKYISDLTLGDRLYTRDQLELVEDSKENIYTYRDTVTGLFKKYPIATSDIELLVQAIETPEEYLGRVRSVSKKYNEYLIQLVSMEVPYAIAGRHTELINSVSQMAAAFDNLLQEEIDELVSLSALVQMRTLMDDVADAIININAFFEIVKDPSIFE